MDVICATSCDDRNQVSSAQQGYFVVLTKGKNAAVEAVCGDVKFELFECSELDQIADPAVAACAGICNTSDADFDHAYLVHTLDKQLALMIGLAGAEHIVKIESDADCERMIEISSAAVEVVNCMDLLKDARNSQGRINRILGKSKHACVADVDHDYDSSIDYALIVSTQVYGQLRTLFQSQFQLFPIG